MPRMFYAIPPENVGRVPCLWTEGCRNAATHVDEKTEKTICPPCYEASLWNGRKTRTVGSAVERALAAANGQARSSLKVFADEAMKAAEVASVAADKRRKRPAGVPKKQASAPAGVD